MSANNYILIDRDTLEVSMRNADTGGLLGKIRKSESLEEAIDIAQEIEADQIIEYGIEFTSGGGKQ